MRLSRLFAGLPVTWLRPGDAEITLVTVDEREVRPGALYVARRGYYGDGHQRLGPALAAGASALLVADPAPVPADASLPVAVGPEQDPLLALISARFYEQPTAGLRVYGVTGTNGKTSVAFLLEHMLRAVGERPALMGTIEYRLGDRAHPASNTTPEALFVQRFARRALAAGATSLVLEVSSHALAIGRSAEVLFDRVGFTNLTHEHLDFHGTMDRYREAKAQLFSAYLTEAQASGKRPLAVACVDDRAGWDMLGRVPAGVDRLAVATSADHRADVRIALDAARGVAGCQFQLEAPVGRWQGRTALLGRHNLANVALAAAMVGGDDAERWRRAVASLASFPGIVGRLEPVSCGCAGDRAVFVDYAHSPDALERALGVLRDLDAGPVTVVVGCGGDRDRSKRGPMARAAQAGARRAIFTSDNPRSEDPHRILDDMMAELVSAEPRPEREPDRAAAIDRAIAASAAGPILVAGKGHERYQERGGIRFHFDDREEARRALGARRLALGSRDAPLLLGWSARRLARALAGRRLTVLERTTLEHSHPFAAMTGDGAWHPRLRVALDDFAVMLGLEDLVDARWRLLGEIVSEARRRPAGLWTAWVVAERAEQAVELARRLAALDPAEPMRIATAPMDADPFADALTSLAPAHRGLVIAAGGDELARSADRLDRLAPELLIAASPAAAAAAAPALEASEQRGWRPVYLGEPELASLTPAGWADWLAPARQQALARYHPRSTSRPIPVPDDLALAPAR